MKNIKFSDKFYYSKQFIIFLKGFSKTDFKISFWNVAEILLSFFGILHEMVVQMWPYLSNKTQIFKKFLLFFFFPLLLFFLENQTCIICLFLSLNISRSFNTNLSSAQRWRVSKTQHKSATKEEKRGKRQWSRERKSRERKSPIPFHFLYRDRERGSECELPLSVSQASSSAIPSLQCLLNFDVFFVHFFR